MKHILSYVSAIIAAFCLVSCDKQNEPEEITDSYGFEGQYEMRTEVKTIFANGEEDVQSRTMVSPVSMYIENKHLYLRTNSFGMPNMGEYDLVEVEYTMEQQNNAPMLTENTNEDSVAIENTETNSVPMTVIRNGFVYVIKNNKSLKSLPIPALKVKENQLQFANSDKFDVALTNADGDALATLRCYFEYKKATRKDKTITWDVILHLDGGQSSSVMESIERIEYHNTLVQK